MFLRPSKNVLTNFRFAWTKVPLEYQQGRWIDGVREYFYYIDHNGQLFMDDQRMMNFTSCFKDKQFLAFFFRRLQHTSVDKYKEYFPYTSKCGKEQNYIRCDDRPVVFTSIDRESGEFEYNKSTRSIQFEPSKLCMFPNGRLYHPSPFDNYGLVTSQLADELYAKFKFDSNGKPTHFEWNGETLPLTNELLKFAPQKD
uniref:Uncharacterized protein n=1 Tax=Panagrolaimus superbus TaxID=310955 RepID=A0A914YDN1_9BILA